MTLCYIGIGSNLGDRQGYIDSAIKELRKHKSISVLRISKIYETDPVSNIPQGKFLNGVMEVETDIKPRALLQVLLNIELKLGRKRAIKNEPRTIDLDILYYGDEHISDHGLCIPHPRIQEREFVLRGLRELGKQ
jgi:2-amino-4-hydroxy-6-hydroxymethyldihydropteridine diphosphokinase